MFGRDKTPAPLAPPAPASQGRGRQPVTPNGVDAALTYQPPDDFATELLRREDQARQLAEDERLRKQAERDQAPKRAAKAQSQKVTPPAKRAKRSITELQDEHIATANEVFSDGVLVLLAAIGWLLNGLTTALSIQSMFSPSAAAFGFCVGLILHVIISRFEMSYLVWWRFLTWYAVPLTIAIIIDVGSASDGLRIIAALVDPEQFGSMPNVLMQVQQIVTSQDTRAWIVPAAAFAVAGTFIALLIERILVPLWRAFRLSYHSWREGMTIGEVKDEWAGIPA